jgi:hypothetical protein
MTIEKFLFEVSGDWALREPNERSIKMYGIVFTSFDMGTASISSKHQT